MAQNDVKEVLNTFVATEGLLYTRLHQFHWYLKGPQFFTLHEQFEELYKSAASDMDAVAERLISIGGEPYATLEEFKQHAVITENADDKNLSQDKMVEAIIKDYQSIQTFLTEAIKLTDQEEDFVSNDMLIAKKGEVDKTLWMLQAYLG